MCTQSGQIDTGLSENKEKQKCCLHNCKMSQGLFYIICIISQSLAIKKQYMNYYSTRNTDLQANFTYG